MANLVQGENYGNPAELEQIKRRQLMAQQLMQQGQEPLQGQMVSGHYVAPSITQYLSKGLGQYLGAKGLNNADKQLQDYQTQKQKAIADVLMGNNPQQVNNNSAEQPMRQETPDEMQNRQRQMLYGLTAKYGNDPSLQLALGDLNYQRERGARKEDIADTRQYEDKIYNRGRADKLNDTDAERKYQDIVRKDAQGFQVSQQDRQFAQQFQMQAQNQGFQANQQAKSQAFTAGQNALTREQQMSLMALKQNQPNSPIAKANDARDVLSILDQADPLVKQATSSGLGAAYDTTAGFFGKSSAGADAAAKLKALEGNLVSKMPKMSGPQSDKDVLMYKQMAGRIGDPTVPVSQKQAAIEAIREINSRYAGVPYQQNNIMPKGEMMPNANGVKFMGFE